MPLEFNLGTSQVTTVTNLPYNAWKGDALQKVTDEGNLVKLTDVYAPLDTPCSIKLTNTRIANVYNTLAKGGVPPVNQAANVTGQSIFVEVSVMASSGTGAAKILVPMIGRLELRLPNNGDMTEADVKKLIGLIISSLSADDTAATRVTEMMRGSLRQG